MRAPPERSKESLQDCDTGRQTRTVHDREQAIGATGDGAVVHTWGDAAHSQG